jgi:hypothetical protein
MAVQLTKLIRTVEEDLAAVRFTRHSLPELRETQLRDGLAASGAAISRYRQPRPSNYEAHSDLALAEWSMADSKRLPTISQPLIDRTVALKAAYEGLSAKVETLQSSAFKGWSICPSQRRADQLRQRLPRGRKSSNSWATRTIHKCGSCSRSGTSRQNS